MTRPEDTHGTRSVRTVTWLLIMMALAMVSCTPPEDAPAAASPPGGSTGTTSEVDRPHPLLPQVVLPDGFEISLELAITPDELAQGLMFRPKLAEDRGMLLIFSEERLPSIWMMNTLVALDLIYLDHRGVVVDVVTDAQPCPSEPCPRFVPKAPAQAVLEIPAGGATRHGVVDGERLRFERVPEFPLPERTRHPSLGREFEWAAAVSFFPLVADVSSPLPFD